jgi:predicted metal-dependent hydrolase
VFGDAVPLAWRSDRPARVVTRPDGLAVGGAPDAAEAAVLRWYRREARTRLAAAVAREAARLRVAAPRLSIRDPRTRWGSCSSRGGVSLSWRLLLGPEPVADAVVVHELCHLIEPNHSPAFWRLLASRRPGWPEEAGWLRDHGHELQAYRPRLGQPL